MFIREFPFEEFSSLTSSFGAELFGDTLFMPLGPTRSENEIAKFESLDEINKKRNSLNLIAFDDKDSILGWSSSYQSKTYELYTRSSVVLPDHRRKGIYSALTSETLKRSQELGYQLVSSCHVASNNPVIIAKLKLGFRISGMELMDDIGLTVRLVFYHNRIRSEAFDFRTGFQKPSPELKTLLKL